MHLSALLSSMHCKNTGIKKKTYEKCIEKPNQMCMQILEHFISRNSIFLLHSFGMAHSFVDSIGDVDVISDAEVNNKNKYIIAFVFKMLSTLLRILLDVD